MCVMSQRLGAALNTMSTLPCRMARYGFHVWREYKLSFYAIIHLFVAVLPLPQIEMMADYDYSMMGLNNHSMPM